MKKSLMVSSLIGVALMVTGCESSKKDIVAMPLNIIAHNLSSTACSFLAIGTIKEKAGFTNLLYHEDANTVTCDDYNGKSGLCIEENDLIAKGSTGYGDRACVFASDEAPQVKKKDDKETKDVNNVTSKNYLLVVKNTSTFSCNSYSISEVSKKYDYKGDLIFYIDKDNTATCASYGRTATSGDKCEEGDINDKVTNKTLIGEWTCVIGTDQAPSK